MKKLFLLFLIPSICGAWELPSSDVHLKSNVSVSAINPTAQGNDEIDLIPTGSLGFSINSGSAPSYGYSGGWDIVLDHVSQGSTLGTATVSPYLGAGFSLYFDAAPVINSNFQSAPLLDGGFNIIGPDIQGLVPTAVFVWNFNNKNETILVGFTAPFSILESAIVQVKQF